MTLEQIQGTKVLAEFEGWVDVSSKRLNNILRGVGVRLFEKDGKPRWLNDFDYHTSLDALWPVWVKFRDAATEELKNRAMTDYYANPIRFSNSQLNEYYERRERIARSLAYDSHEKAFSHLVEAVEWLNKISKS